MEQPPRMARSISHPNKLEDEMHALHTTILESIDLDEPTSTAAAKERERLKNILTRIFSTIPEDVKLDRMLTLSDISSAMRMPLAQGMSKTELERCRLIAAEMATLFGLMKLTIHEGGVVISFQVDLLDVLIQNKVSGKKRINIGANDAS